MNKNFSVNTVQLDQLVEFDNLDRKQSLELFESQGFPHPKMEKWQKSTIRKVLKQDFVIDSGQVASMLAKTVETPFKVDRVFDIIDGLCRPDSTLNNTKEGVIYGSLKAAIKSHPDLLKNHLNRYVNQDLNGLSAMNSALFNDGFFLYVPKNVHFDETLYWRNFHNDVNLQFSQQRNLIIIESGASFSLLQSELSKNEGSAFSNSVTEVYVGSNAELNWYSEQEIGPREALINHIFVQQEKDSRFTVINTSLRANLIRNDVRVKMDGEGCESNVMGLYLPHSNEQVDNQVFMDHAKPNCVSNELFKGVLDGKGSSIFNGHILVQQDAQKTNAYQTNRNIVLSDDANAFAKPFLEIYADDVKCSHGATIGQLDQQALFYLRSRGLNEKSAKSFLIKAFVGEVLDNCSNEPFRHYLEGKVKDKLDQ